MIQSSECIWVRILHKKVLWWRSCMYAKLAKEFPPVQFALLQWEALKISIRIICCYHSHLLSSEKRKDMNIQSFRQLKTNILFLKNWKKIKINRTLYRKLHNAKFMYIIHDTSVNYYSHAHMRTVGVVIIK